ncbi:MAG: phosphoribosyltransferase family protein [Rhodomicrobium sp.]
MIYKNRSDAGRRLARELSRYRRDEPIILALPRGGVIVAAAIARAFDAPLDLILVRKLGVPWQPELAMGAVVDGTRPYVVVNEDILGQLDMPEEVFEEICERELEEIERRRRLYLKDRPRADLEDRVAIVVDDGIATGATTRAALKAVRKRMPRWLVLAVPVAPVSTLEKLRGEADDVVCPESPEPFYSIGSFYEDFHQVSDSEVIDTLSEVRAPPVLRTKEAKQQTNIG